MLPTALLLLSVLASPAAAADPVAVTLYYESLCPYCRDFIVGSFSEAWEAVPEIMDVTFLPWGNERSYEQADGSVEFSCQHGEQECYLNVVHACALKMAPSNTVGINFIVCMESNGQDTLACAAQNGLDGAALESCAIDPAMDAEMLRLRDITDAAEPALRGVPTVEVNGSQHPQNEIINDLLTVVCREYQGTKPAGCP